jgi:hypothetical protein
MPGGRDIPVTGFHPDGTVMTEEAWKEFKKHYGQ